MTTRQKFAFGALVGWVVLIQIDQIRMTRYLNHLADCTQRYMQADMDEDVREKFTAMTDAFGDAGGDNGG